jgi:VanZ family protein
VVVYALSDEFHQSFVPSRGASILDSMIDSLGGLIALTVLIFRGRVQKSRVSTARGSERIQTNS